MKLAGQLDQFALVGARRVPGSVSSITKGLELRVAIPKVAQEWVECHAGSRFPAIDVSNPA